MRAWFIVLLFLLLAIAGVAIYAFYPSSTGNTIQWDTGELHQGEDFSSSPPVQFSPLPSNQTGIGGVDARCDEAKNVRASVCKSYTEGYPDGCKWWYFFFVRKCYHMRTSCIQSQQNVTAACSLNITG